MSFQCHYITSLLAFASCLAQTTVKEANSGFQFPVADVGGGFTFAEDSRDAKMPVYKCWVYHPGWDMNPAGGNADLGTPVLAAANGTVVTANKTRGQQIWGRLVIQHLYNGQTFYTQYGHVAGSSILVSVGDPVVKGQKIAEVGKEGTNYAHLHFEVRTAVHPSPADGIFWQVCSNSASSRYLVFQNQANVHAWYLDPMTFVPAHGPYTLSSTVTTNATIDGQPWASGPRSPVSYLLGGPANLLVNGDTVPFQVTSASLGSYTLNFTSGGPPNSTLTGILPCGLLIRGQFLCAATLNGHQLTFTLQFTSNPPAADFVWPVPGHDTQRTGLANHVGPGEVPNGRAPRWSYATGTAVVGDIVVSAEGTLYVASDKLYALTSSGNLYAPPVTFDRGVPLSSPAIDDTNGFVYVVVSSPNPANNPNLRAYDVVRLSKQLTSQTTVYHSPYPYSNPNIVPHGLLIGTDGTVYFTDGATVVARGVHSWTTGMPNTGPCFGNPGFLTPTLGSDGSVLVPCQAYGGTSYGAGLYKFDAATGAQLKYTSYPYMRVEFMLDTQNHIRAGDSSSFGVNSTGHYDAWDTNLALISDVPSDDTSSRSALLPDGSSTVRIGKSTLVDPTNTFYYDPNYQGAQTNTLSARGAHSWDIRGGTGGSTSFFSTVPSVDSAGNIFVGTVAGVESRSGVDGSLIWSFATGDTVTTQPVIAGPSVLYVGTSTGKLYAF